MTKRNNEEKSGNIASGANDNSLTLVPLDGPARSSRSTVIFRDSFKETERGDGTLDFSFLPCEIADIFVMADSYGDDCLNFPALIRTEQADIVLSIANDGRYGAWIGAIDTALQIESESDQCLYWSRLSSHAKIAGNSLLEISLDQKTGSVLLQIIEDGAVKSLQMYELKKLALVN